LLSIGTCAPGPDAGAIPQSHNEGVTIPGFDLLSLAISYPCLNMRPLVKGFPTFTSSSVDAQFCRHFGTTSQPVHGNTRAESQTLSWRSQHIND
jgi:hypothetical protein